MAGPRSSPWVKLLLAAMLSVSLPGNMGESEHPFSPLQEASDMTLHKSVSLSGWRLRIMPCLVAWDRKEGGCLGR